MADLSFTAQLDSKGFLTELNAMEKATRERAAKTRDYLRQMERREDRAARGGNASAGVNAAIKAVASVKLLKEAWTYASDAVEKYAKKNEVTSGAMAAAEAAMENLSDTIGRALAPWVELLADGLTDLVRGVDRAATSIRNWTTDLFNGAGAAATMNAAIAQQEAALLRYGEAAKKLEETNLAEALGLSALKELKAASREAATSRMELLDPDGFTKATAGNKRADDLAKVNDLYGQLTAAQKKSFDLAGLTYDINSRYNQELAQIAFRHQEAADAAQAEQRAVDATAESRNRELDFMLAGRELDLLRMNNQNDKADLAALELEYARELNGVLGDTSIHELDRVATAERLLRLYDDQKTATEGLINQRAAPESTRARTLASGLGGGLSSQVLGIGSGVVSDSKSIATATLDSSKRLAEAVGLLKQIRDKNNAGTFGP